MTVELEERVATLERELSVLKDRVDASEPRSVARRLEPAPRSTAAPRHAREFRFDDSPPVRRQVEQHGSSLRTLFGPGKSFEELLGGRLLALAGGIAVLLGIAFLVALAIDRGWLGAEARVGLALIGAAMLLAVGVWLHERLG
jgi:uncharacterized membrane protein